MSIEHPVHQTQSRLLRLAGLFLFLYAAVLTLSPVIRTHTWDTALRWDHWLAVFLWISGFGFTHYQTKKHFQKFDPFLIPIAALITGWGLLTIWRLSPSFGLRQTIWLVIGLIIFNFGLRLSPKFLFLRRYKYIWLSSGLLLVGVTLFFGTNPSGFGPRLWLGCCGVYFQPSEPLKLLLIAYLAAYLADRQHMFLNFFSLLAPTIIMAGVSVLILFIQRDLGTASIFWFIYTSVIYTGTGKRRFLFTSILTLIILGIVGYLFFDVVKLRVDAWINPWEDPTGRSYQIIQALIAAANGGILGRGLGLGNPGLVPLAHSDFIFTTILEETGLIGGLGIIALLSVFLTRGLRIALTTPDPYKRYLTSGIITYIIGQSILIIGGNLRFLPLTGVTLPFMSYGGSSLVTLLIALLFIVICSTSQSEQIPHPSPNPQPFLEIGGGLMIGLTLASAYIGYWAIIQGPQLLERTDNFRKVIADRFISRGNIVDRYGNILAYNSGNPGEYSRVYAYPTILSSVIGYSNATYGQTGLEASMDDYLRGLDGSDQTEVWINNLVYGQHPPGKKVRISIDLDTQLLIDEYISGYQSAALLLDARSGEILVMSSYPGFDPNNLTESWENLIQDIRAPLLNRTTQGQYPLGSVFAPIWLAAAQAADNLPEIPENYDFQLQEGFWHCTFTPRNDTWPEIIRAGCPNASPIMVKTLEPETIQSIYTSLGFYNSPTFPELPVLTADTSVSTEDHVALVYGTEAPYTTPLQLALALATISNQGYRPGPRLAIAVQTTDGEWTALKPPDAPTQIEQFSDTNAILGLLRVEGLPIWQLTTVTPISIENQDSNSMEWITWSIGGTLPSWESTPIVGVILIEGNEPSLAEEAGKAMLLNAIQP